MMRTKGNASVSRAAQLNNLNLEERLLILPSTQNIAASAPMFSVKEEISNPENLSSMIADAYVNNQISVGLR